VKKDRQAKAMRIMVVLSARMARRVGCETNCEIDSMLRVRDKYEEAVGGTIDDNLRRFDLVSIIA
jgi:hypothetical protein